MTVEGSSPKSVGVDTTPVTLWLLSTKSTILQSVLPVLGESRIPLPILNEQIILCRTTVRLRTDHLRKDVLRPCRARNDYAINIRYIRTLSQNGFEYHQTMVQQR